MEMMFVSQDLRDITPAASSFSLSPMRHCMVGRQSHFGPVGLGLENPSEHICPGLYQGQEDRRRRVPKVSHGQAWARAGGRPGPSGWKARASPDGFAHYPHMARGDVESDGFWELCLAQE